MIAAVSRARREPLDHVARDAGDGRIHEQRRTVRDRPDGEHRTAAGRRVVHYLRPAVVASNVGRYAFVQNTATAMGRMFLTLTAAFAELERNLIAERTQAALFYKKSNRLVYRAIPYGYSRYGDALKVVDMELDIIREVQEWHTRGWPLRKIADALNRRKVRTKRGRHWHASTIRHILQNSLHQHAE